LQPSCSLRTCGQSQTGFSRSKGATPAPLGTSFKATTWNSAALLHQEPTQRKRRLALLSDICRCSDFVLAQEAHANESELRIALPQLSALFHVEVSEGPNAATGGVITFIKKTWAGSDAVVVSRAVVMGRVLRSVIDRPGSRFIVWNVHNFGLSAPAMDRVVAGLRADSAEAAAAPQQVFLVVAGDLNFRDDGEEEFDMKNPDNSFGTVTKCDKQQHAATWRKALSPLTDVHGGEPTHWSAQHSKASRIDKIFVAHPGWQLTSGSCSAKTLRDATSLRRGCSDHVPFQVCIGPGSPPSSSSLPIPLWVCQSPIFKDIVAKLQDAVDWSSLGCWDKLLRQKKLLRTAGKLARNLLLSGALGPKAPPLAVLQSVARAVWRSDTRTARALALTSSAAAAYLDLSGPLVALRNPDAFHRDFTAAKIVQLDAAAAPARPKEAKKSPASRAAATRKRSLWNSLGKMLILTALRTATGRIITDKEDIDVALCEAWAPKFSKATVDVERLEQICATWARPLDLAGVCPPSAPDYIAVWDRCRNSAPGPDGIPFAAWRASGLFSAELLCEVEAKLRDGTAPPLWWNAAIWVFIPKGVDPDAAPADLVVEPEETRPLGLKDTSNKSVGSAWLWKLRGPQVAHACAAQRGFVPTRNFVQNVIELDVDSRKCSLLRDAPLGPTPPPRPGVRPLLPARDASPPARLLPALLTWDFATAFPSVAHQALWIVLRAMAIPTGLINLFKSMYWFASARACSDPSKILFFVFRGVIQGCALSGLLFTWLLDPFLCWMVAVLESRGLGLVRACADDIGSTLRHVASLLQLKEIFDVIEATTNLSLKMVKCKLVPLIAEFSEAVALQYRTWILAHIPAWHAMQIVPKAKYLGFVLGPAADFDDFVAPLAKLKARVKMLAASLLAPKPAVAAFNTRAVTVLGYVAQLSPPPPCGKVDLWCCNKIWRMPGTAMSLQLGYSLDSLGLPKMQVPSLLCLATLMRTACDKKLDWSTPLAELTYIAADKMIARRTLCDDRPWPDFWAKPPFAWFLAKASAGASLVTPSKFLHGAVAAAARAAHKFVKTPATSEVKARGSLQALLTATFRAQCLSWHGLATEVARRWALILGIRSGDIGITDEDIEREMKACPPRHRPDAFRLLINGIPTAQRMHSVDKRHGCLFRCPLALADAALITDSMKHYSSCETFTACFDSAMGPFAARASAGAACARWGIAPTSWQRLTASSVVLRTAAAAPHLDGLQLCRAAARAVLGSWAPAPAVEPAPPAAVAPSAAPAAAAASEPAPMVPLSSGPALQHELTAPSSGGEGATPRKSLQPGPVASLCAAGGEGAIPWKSLKPGSVASPVAGGPPARRRPSWSEAMAIVFKHGGRRGSEAEDECDDTAARSPEDYNVTDALLARASCLAGAALAASATSGAAASSSGPAPAAAAPALGADFLRLFGNGAQASSSTSCLGPDPVSRAAPFSDDFLRAFGERPESETASEYDRRIAAGPPPLPSPAASSCLFAGGPWSGPAPDSPPLLGSLEQWHHGEPEINISSSEGSDNSSCYLGRERRARRCMRADWARRNREQAEMDSLLRAQELATNMDEDDEIAALHALAELDALYDSDAEMLHLANLGDELVPPPTLLINLTEDDVVHAAAAPDGAASSSCMPAAPPAALVATRRPVPPSPRRPSAAAWLARGLAWKADQEKHRLKNKAGDPHECQGNCLDAACWGFRGAASQEPDTLTGGGCAAAAPGPPPTSITFPTEDEDGQDAFTAAEVPDTRG
jgi:hypothetical protein